MKEKLLFWTAFNSYRSSKLLRDKPAGTPHPVTTDAWTAARVQLFRRFNLPSILNQTHGDFLYAVVLDPELRRLAERHLPPTPDPRVVYCFEDRAALDLLDGYDRVVLALIDNDDMYGRDAGALMMACPAEWMYFKRGFAFEPRSNRLWHYDTIGTGPFWARRIAVPDLRRAGFDRDKRHPNHKAVVLRNPTELRAGQFCVLLHDRNTSSTTRMRYVKAPVVNNGRLLRHRFALGRA